MKCSAGKRCFRYFSKFDTPIFGNCNKGDCNEAGSADGEAKNLPSATLVLCDDSTADDVKVAIEALASNPRGATGAASQGQKAQASKAKPKSPFMSADIISTEPFPSKKNDPAGVAPNGNGTKPKE